MLKRFPYFPHKTHTFIKKIKEHKNVTTEFLIYVSQEIKTLNPSIKKTNEGLKNINPNSMTNFRLKCDFFSVDLDSC